MLGLIEKFLLAWTGASRRAGWFLVLLFSGLTIAGGWYAAGNLKVNTDTSAMLDPALPFQQRAAELRSAFPEIKEDIAVIVRAPTLDETDAFVAALRQRALEKPDVFTGVFAPSAEPFFRENGLLYLAPDELESRLAQMSKAASLIETLVKSPRAGTLFMTLADNDALAERSDLGRETLSDIYAELADVVEAGAKSETRPFSWMGALDPDHDPAAIHQGMVYVTPVLDYSRLQPAKPAIEELRNEIAEIRKSFDGRVETFITGDPALRADELNAVTTGIALSFLISFIAVGILLFLAYRSFFLSAITLSSLVITIVLTACFATLAIGELNLVSVAFAVLLVGLGLDFAIHLLLHVQERRVAGQTTAEALRGSVHEVGAALTLAAFTTTLGFFAFVPTKFDGIAQLGVIAGVGVIIALLVSITFLPAALGAAPNFKARASGGVVRSGFAFIERLSIPIAVATIALGAASLVLLPKARFDADPMALRDPKSQSVIGFNHLFDDADTLPYRLTRIVSSEEDAVDTAARAKLIDTVASVRSLPDFVPEDQDDKLDLIDFAAGSLVFALNADEDASAAPGVEDGARALSARLTAAHNEGTPARRLAAALDAMLASGDEDYVERVEKNIFAYWPNLVGRLRDQLNAAYVDLDELPENLTRRYLSAGGQWRIDILPKEDVRDSAALDRFVRSVEAEFADIGGGAVQTEKAGEIISGSMLQAFAIALVIITLFLWLLMQRIYDVALMLFPLGLAAVLTIAAGVVFNIPFNYANVIVLPLLLGIGVDSAIHLVLRNRQIADGESVYGTSTPRAVLFSALTTVASFGSLMLSPHRGTASMGELLSIAIAFTLVCTLIVLPTAFRLLEARKPG